MVHLFGGDGETTDVVGNAERYSTWVCGGAEKDDGTWLGKGTEVEAVGGRMRGTAAGGGARDAWCSR